MNIYDEVKGAVTIGISGHIRPDGDCIGAAVGLYLYLKKACPSAGQLWRAGPARQGYTTSIDPGGVWASHEGHGNQKADEGR